MSLPRPEVSLQDLRSHMLFFAAGQSLSTSSSSLPPNNNITNTREHTHMHTHTRALPDYRTAPVIADPLSEMACANQRNVPWEKDVFHNQATGCSSVNQSLVAPGSYPCLSIVIVFPLYASPAHSQYHLSDAPPPTPTPQLIRYLLHTAISSIFFLLLFLLQRLT